MSTPRKITPITKPGYEWCDFCEDFSRPIEYGARCLDCTAAGMEIME